MCIVKRRRLQSEEGFTIVEVMVASMLLLVGLLGTLALMDGATQTLATSKAREGGTNLAREVLERSRSLPFSTLTSASLTTSVRAMPDMGGGTSGTWTITRRGIAYTVSPVVCALDDPADGLGAHTAGAFCASSSAVGTADTQPEDFKRVAVTVTWRASGANRTATLTAVRSNRSAAEAPVVSALTTTSPAVSDPAAPVISNPATTTATFKITASSSAASVVVSLDGVDLGSATSLGNGKDWTYTVNVSTSALSDGTYSLGARAVDARTNAGPTVTIPLTLARSAPAAPAGLQGGRNEVLDGGVTVDAAELDWLPSPERNVIGYRVYRPDNSRVCPGTTTEIRVETWCVDTNPQAGVYGVVALYRDASNVLRESAKANVNIQAALRIFYLTNVVQSPALTQTNCGSADLLRSLTENYSGVDPAASEPSANNDDVLRFCTPPLTTTAVKAGTANVHLFMSNGGGSPCPVTVSVGQVGGGSLTTPSQSVPQAQTTVAAFTYQFSFPAVTLAAGTRLYVLVTLQSGAACNSLRIRHGGTTNRSRLELPRDWTKPGPPSATAQAPVRDADGAVTLQWNASSTPAADLFGYRIYRDGKEWTDRIGSTGDGTTLSFVDPNRDGGTHTYWVTAVNQALAESDPISLGSG